MEGSQRAAHHHQLIACRRLTSAQKQGRPLVPAERRYAAPIGRGHGHRCRPCPRPLSRAMPCRAGSASRHFVFKTLQFKTLCLTQACTIPFSCIRARPPASVGARGCRKDCDGAGGQYWGSDFRGSFATGRCPRALPADGLATILASIQCLSSRPCSCRYDFELLCETSEPEGDGQFKVPAALKTPAST